MFTVDTYTPAMKEIYIACLIKSEINKMAHTGDPVYKWLDDRWTVSHILNNIKYKNFKDKEGGITYLLDYAKKYRYYTP